MDRMQRRNKASFTGKTWLGDFYIVLHLSQYRHFLQSLLWRKARVIFTNFIQMQIPWEI